MNNYFRIKKMIVSNEEFQIIRILTDQYEELNSVGKNIDLKTPEGFNIASDNSFYLFIRLLIGRNVSDKEILSNIYDIFLISRYFGTFALLRTIYHLLKKVNDLPLSILFWYSLTDYFNLFKQIISIEDTFSYIDEDLEVKKMNIGWKKEFDVPDIYSYFKERKRAPSRKKINNKHILYFESVNRYIFEFIKKEKELIILENPEFMNIIGFYLISNIIVSWDESHQVNIFQFSGKKIIVDGIEFTIMPPDAKKFITLKETTPRSNGREGEIFLVNYSKFHEDVVNELCSLGIIKEWHNIEYIHSGKIMEIFVQLEDPDISWIRIEKETKEPNIKLLQNVEKGTEKYAYSLIQTAQYKCSAKYLVDLKNLNIKSDILSPWINMGSSDMEQFFLEFIENLVCEVNLITSRGTKVIKFGKGNLNIMIEPRILTKIYGNIDRSKGLMSFGIMNFLSMATNQAFDGYQTN